MPENSSERIYKPLCDENNTLCGNFEIGWHTQPATEIAFYYENEKKKLIL